MKIWVDDVRPAPKGYVWIKSVNEFISFHRKNWNEIVYFDCMAKECLNNHKLRTYHQYMEMIRRRNIEFIDIDHDAGEYSSQGGDYIKILDWLEESGYQYPIRIHSMNPVGVENMRRIIHKNGWKEV